MSLRGCYVCFASILLASTTFAQTFNIQPLTGPNAPTQSLTEDVNRDGWPDIVSIDTIAGLVRVYLNNRSGGFPAFGSSTYNVPATPIGMVQADFDRDGITDLVIISLGDINCSSPSYSFLHGNGNGTFRAAVNKPLSFCPGSINLTDLNGDHLPDVAIGPQQSEFGETIHIFQNDGHAVFTDVLDIPAPGGGFVRNVATGDFNRDGRQDLALITPGEEPNFLVYVLFNNGNGTFTPRLVTTIVAAIPTDMVAADVTADGAPDLLVTVAATVTGVAVVINNGTAAWSLQFLTVPQLTANQVSLPVVADFRLTGLRDIAVGVSGAPGDGGMVIFPALSRSTWGTPKVFASSSDSSVVGPIGDFNRDGRPDMAFGGSPNRFLIALNTTSATTCASPAATPGIRICAPGATSPSPVSISARARWDGKRITFMRAYIDFKPRCDAAGSGLTCSPPLAAGTHNLTINFWNSAGQVITSSKTFTVK